MEFKPLSNGYLLIGLIGLAIVSFKLAYGTFDPTWGFTLIVIFIVFISASFISLTPNESDFVDKEE